MYLGIDAHLKSNKTAYNGLNPVNGQVIPSGTIKPTQAEIDPFTEELTYHYTSQIEDLTELLESIAFAYQNERDINKKIVLHNKLIVTQNKLIKAKQARHKLTH